MRAEQASEFCLPWNTLITRLLLFVSIAWVVAAGPGCAFKGSTPVLAPVGPAPSAAVRKMQEGQLIVYSGLAMGSSSDKERMNYHSDSQVFAPRRN